MGKNTPASSIASITDLKALQAEETVNTTANVEEAATEETSKGSGKGKKAAAARPCLGMAGAVAARTYHIIFAGHGRLLGEDSVDWIS